LPGLQHTRGFGRLGPGFAAGGQGIRVTADGVSGPIRAIIEQSMHIARSSSFSTFSGPYPRNPGLRIRPWLAARAAANRGIPGHVFKRDKSIGTVNQTPESQLFVGVTNMTLGLLLTLPVSCEGTSKPPVGPPLGHMHIEEKIQGGRACVPGWRFGVFYGPKLAVPNQNCQSPPTSDQWGDTGAVGMGDPVARQGEGRVLVINQRGGFLRIFLGEFIKFSWAGGQTESGGSDLGLNDGFTQPRIADCVH